MADFNPVGSAESFVAGNVVNRLTGGIPFMPNFYNSRYSDPRQGVANSEAVRIARGDRGALKNYGARQVGKTVGAGIGSSLGPPGAIIGGMLGGWAGPHFLNLVQGHGWNGDKNLTPSVTVGDTISDPSQMDESLRNGTTFFGNGAMPVFNNPNYYGLPTPPSNGFDVNNLYPYQGAYNSDPNHVDNSPTWGQNNNDDNSSPTEGGGGGGGGGSSGSGGGYGGNGFSPGLANVNGSSWGTGTNGSGIGSGWGTADTGMAMTAIGVLAASNGMLNAGRHKMIP